MMNKEQYISKIRESILSLPEAYIESSLQYYSEMIDDRVEDGMAEEDAVAEMVSVEEAVAQILRDKPAEEIKENKAKAHKNKKEIFIIVAILSAPVVLPVVFSLAVALLTVLILLYSVPVALIAGGLGCIVKAVALAVVEAAATEAVLYFGVGLSLSGISILLFIAAHYFAKLVKFLCKKSVAFVKGIFSKKEKEI